MGEAIDPRAIGDRIEQLLAELDARADPRTVARAEELVRLVTELYGAGLERIVELCRAESPSMLDAMANDDLVASLLMIHDLHPAAVTQRVAAALESVRPFLRAHEGDVELLALDESVGAVYLRLVGSCDGCPSSAVTLRTTVERAIHEAAPEIVRIDVDEPSAGSNAIPVAMGRKPAQTYDPATGCGAAAGPGTR
jgi:Fe-S cluster biogenesis protein NfuA